jgi:hypothetical protein
MILIVLFVNKFVAETAVVLASRVVEIAFSSHQFLAVSPVPAGGFHG